MHIVYVSVSMSLVTGAQWLLNPCQQRESCDIKVISSVLIGRDSIGSSIRRQLIVNVRAAAVLQSVTSPLRFYFWREGLLSLSVHS